MRLFFILAALFGLSIFGNLFSKVNEGNIKQDSLVKGLNPEQNHYSSSNQDLIKSKVLDNNSVIVNKTKNRTVNLSQSGGSANYPRIVSDASGRYVYAI